jgi:hypothetical protein
VEGGWGEELLLSLALLFFLLNNDILLLAVLVEEMKSKRSRWRWEGSCGEGGQGTSGGVWVVENDCGSDPLPWAEPSSESDELKKESDFTPASSRPFDAEAQESLQGVEVP